VKVLRSRRTLAPIVVSLAAVLGATFLSDFDLRLANLAAIASIAVIGLYFAFGLAGMIHLAQAAFVGIGAYASGLTAQVTGLSPLIAIVIGTVVAGIAGALLAYPMHRTRSHYLALTTVGFSISFEVIVRNWISLTGGYDGLDAIPLLRIAGIGRSDFGFFLISIGVLLLSMLVAELLRLSHFGRALIAVRDDELAAAACGVNIASLKSRAFILCSAYGGLSGALYAHYSGFISPDDFGLTRSIMLLAMLIVGGEFFIVGAVIGSAFLTYVPEWLRFVGGGYMAVFGVFMLLVLILMPNGIMGSLANLRRPRLKAGQ
jgi:branched-chain amino acid transport system permease protein